MNRFVTMTVAAACACTMYGQGGRGGPPPTLASATKAAYATLKTNFTQAAEEMPEAGYGFMPDGEPRSFAGWIGHVADSQGRTCSTIAGVAAPPSAAQMTTKADLVAALKKSFDLCDPAFEAITDANAMEVIPGGFGGAMQPRAIALYGLIVHSNECYGASAVYLRLQKLVPPSTQNMGRGGRGGGRGGGGRGGPGGAPKQ